MKQLNVRMPDEHLVAFRRAAARRGLSQGEYLRFLVAKDLEIPAKQLSNHIPAAPSGQTQPPEPSANGAPPAPEAGGESDFEVDVATWVAGRAFIPVALARAAVGNGRFLINGVPCRSEKILHSKLKDATSLEVNGRPI